MKNNNNNNNKNNNNIYKMRRKTLGKRNTRNKKKQLRKMKRMMGTRRQLREIKQMRGGGGIDSELIDYILQQRENYDLNRVKRFLQNGADVHARDSRLGPSSYMPSSSFGQPIFKSLAEWMYANNTQDFTYQPILNYLNQR